DAPRRTARHAPGPPPPPHRRILGRARLHRGLSGVGTAASRGEHRTLCGRVCRFRRAPGTLAGVSRDPRLRPAGLPVLCGDHRVVASAAIRGGGFVPPDRTRLPNAAISPCNITAGRTPAKSPGLRAQASLAVIIIPYTQPATRFGDGDDRDRSHAVITIV